MGDRGDTKQYPRWPPVAGVRVVDEVIWVKIRVRVRVRVGVRVRLRVGLGLGLG